MGVLLDVSPLRVSKPFARLWSTGLVVSISSQMVQMALAYTLFASSGSSLAVGLLGLAIGVPTVVLSLAGGLLADFRSPRMIGIIGVAGQLSVTAAFAALSAAGRLEPPAIYALAAVQAGFGAITAPTRRPYLRTLLPKDKIPSAMSLYMFSMHAGLIAGPLFGGLFLDEADLTVIFAIQLATLSCYLVSVLSLPHVAPLASGRAGLGAVRAGLRTAARLPPVRNALMIDVIMTVVALPVALLPAFNEENLHGDAALYGSLLASISVGGIAATLLSGKIASIRRFGTALVLVASAWSALVAALSFTTDANAAMAILFSIGFLDVWALTLQQAIVQLHTPDEYLGRIGSIQNLVAMGGPQLGNFRAGAAGSIWSTQVAMATGAMASLVLLLVASRSVVRADRRVSEEGLRG